jgi:hypothetical protein
MKNLTFSSPFVDQDTVNLLNSSAFIIPPGTSTITLKPLKVKHFRGLIFYGDRFGDHLKIREYFPIYLLIIFRIQFTAEAQMI